MKYLAPIHLIPAFALFVSVASARADTSYAGPATAWDDRSATHTTSGPYLIDTVLPAAPATSPEVDAGRSRIEAASDPWATSAADTGLWEFVHSVRAQQDGRSFRLLESQLRIFEFDAVNAPAPVPLPGAAWLLVMGVLGLAGIKVTSAPGRRVAGSGQLPQPA